RYDQVIVPLDRSPRAEAALPVARAFATLFGAELLLVHVTWDRDVEESESYLDALATSLVQDRTLTTVRRGWPVPVITELVQQ
uniref:universal stress protein n=1 Tax=Salmonella sp. SAL4433 TaxID=3159888 RepID=UPI00397D20F8